MVVLGALDKTCPVLPFLGRGQGFEWKKASPWRKTQLTGWVYLPRTTAQKTREYIWKKNYPWFKTKGNQSHIFSCYLPLSSLMGLEKYETSFRDWPRSLLTVWPWPRVSSVFPSIKCVGVNSKQLEMELEPAEPRSKISQGWTRDHKNPSIFMFILI